MPALGFLRRHLFRNGDGDDGPRGHLGCFQSAAATNKAGVRLVDGHMQASL